MRTNEKLDFKGFILICEKCGKHADVSSKHIKDEFKSILREKGLKNDLRPLLTSCLDICPKEGIAVTTVSLEQNKQGSTAQVFIFPDSRVHPERLEDVVKSFGLEERI